jgi:exopolysaccharide production protein ExoQ
MTSTFLRWASRNWVMLASLALIIGSDYKFRTRDSTAAISGQIDVFILLELALYGAVGIYLLATWTKPGRVLCAPEVLAAGFYVLMIVMSLSEAPYPAYAGARVVEMLILTGLALTIATRATRSDMHRLAHGFLVLVAGSVILGVLVPSEPISSQQIGRFTWLAIHPTTAGVFVSLAAVIGFVYVTIREHRPGPRWPWWVYTTLLAIVVFGLVATRTRSAVLGAVVGLMACQWTYYRGRRRLELIAISLLVIALVSLTSIPTIEAYFARGESTEQLRTLNERTDLWSLAWQAIQLEPLYGYGIGASQGIFQEQIGLGGGHNAAVNVAVDLGLVGLTIWLGLVVAMLVGLLNLPPSGGAGLAVDRSLMVAILLTIHINGIFYAGPGAVANVAATWMFLVLGWSVRLRRIVGATTPGPAERASAEIR